MAHPARKRRSNVVLQALCDVKESGRAGAAVEVLVAAADRKIDAASVEFDRHSAGTVAQIPEHQRASLVRRVRDRLHVVDEPGPVVDMGQGDDGGVVVDGGDDVLRLPKVPVSDAVLGSAHHPQQSFDDVAVGWKVVGLGDDD